MSATPKRLLLACLLILAAACWTATSFAAERMPFEELAFAAAQAAGKSILVLRFRALVPYLPRTKAHHPIFGCAAGIQGPHHLRCGFRYPEAGPSGAERATAEHLDRIQGRHRGRPLRRQHQCRRDQRVGEKGAVSARHGMGRPQLCLSRRPAVGALALRVAAPSHRLRARRHRRIGGDPWRSPPASPSPSSPSDCSSPPSASPSDLMLAYSAPPPPSC